VLFNQLNKFKFLCQLAIAHANILKTILLIIIYNILNEQVVSLLVISTIFAN